MKPRVLALLSSLSLLSITLLPTGCLQGSALHKEDKQAIIDARGCDVDELFEKCGGSSCHQASALKPVPDGGIDFFVPDFPESAIGQPATYPGYPGCVNPPELIIDPTDPVQKSLFLTKLRGEQVLGCGDGMPTPFSGTRGKALPPSEVQCFEDYIVEAVADWQANGGVLGSGGSGSGGSGGGAASGGATGTGGGASGGGSVGSGGTVDGSGEAAQ